MVKTAEDLGWIILNLHFAKCNDARSFGSSIQDTSNAWKPELAQKTYNWFQNVCLFVFFNNKYIKCLCTVQ